MKVFLLGLLFVANSYADISGRWIGQGEWTYEGSGTHCFMNLSFEENASKLIRKPGFFDCDMVGLDVMPLELTKTGNKLFDIEGNLVGTYIGNKIELTEKYSETVNVETTIVVDGLHFDYQEEWKELNGNLIYLIKGRLFSSK